MAYFEMMDELVERYDLSKNRILDIPEELKEKEASLGEDLTQYFKAVTDYLCMCIGTYEGSLSLKEAHDFAYNFIAKEGYETSFLNPAFAVKKLGENGQKLSLLAADLTACYSYAVEKRLDLMVTLFELFIEIYCILLEEGKEGDIEESIHSFYHDYLDLYATDALLGIVDPGRDFFINIIENEDLYSDDYLYKLGSYIGKNELEMAAHLRTFSEDELKAMADTYVEGFRKGFETTRRDLTIKDSVQIEYPVGMELVVKKAIEEFRELGLSPIIRRESVLSLTGRSGRKRGCYTTSPNPQFEFDHKDDKALYLDKAHINRRLEVTEQLLKENSTKAKSYGGPAVIEVFGATPFEPKSKPENPSYTENQNKLNVTFASKSGQIINEYIPGDETSFTIIAFPQPEIGPRFKEIFDRTVEINNLDYEIYRDMQQHLIDALDKGESVHITGRGENKTDLTVQLFDLKDPEKETIFENCVADVNIPVGEVFTSPKLKGTNGILHVTSVYLNDLNFRNLMLKFKDGMIDSYTCANFEDEEQNQKYVFENVLFRHNTLPMGEFAIGTNTTAYRMARDFDIADKLPILIAEKTGPHFAVGDTCYSHAEDLPMYNPDGKEVVARENDCSLKRHTDPEAAYFNCHTDITIPYDELGDVVVNCADGSEIYLIHEGRFSLAECEQLNGPLDQ